MVKILLQLVSKFGRNRSSHVVPPEHFKKDKNIHAWLDKFELYLTEDNISNNKQRCAALISRLDEECVDTVKHHGARTYDDYGMLKKTLLKLFAISAKTQTERQFEFSKRSQRPNENIHQYYAALQKLSYSAFGNVSKEQRWQFVAERFIGGVISDGLRQEILRTYKSDYRNIIDVADKLETIYNRKQFVCHVGQQLVGGTSVSESHVKNVQK